MVIGGNKFRSVIKVLNKGGSSRAAVVEVTIEKFRVDDMQELHMSAVEAHEQIKRVDWHIGGFFEAIRIFLGNGSWSKRHYKSQII